MGYRTIRGKFVRHGGIEADVRQDGTLHLGIDTVPGGLQLRDLLDNLIEYASNGTGRPA